MIKQTDVKRLLAYSSISHMGVVTFLATNPSLGIPLALLHIFNHSVLKASLFYLAGDIEYSFGVRAGIQGIMSKVPTLSTLILIGALGLEGSPPFSTFYSLFGILFMGRFNTLIIIYLVGVFIGFIAILNRLTEISWGIPKGFIISKSFRIPHTLLVVPCILIALTLILGIRVDLILSVCIEVGMYAH